MPKKTKKAKLIAEYRRTIQRLDDVPPSEQKSTPQIANHSLFTLPVLTPNLSPSSIDILVPVEESRAIKKELLKTLIIVSIFIVFELFLSNILH